MDATGIRQPWTCPRCEREYRLPVTAKPPRFCPACAEAEAEAGVIDLGISAPVSFSRPRHRSDPASAVSALCIVVGIIFLVLAGLSAFAISSVPAAAVLGGVLFCLAAGCGLMALGFILKSLRA